MMIIICTNPQLIVLKTWSMMNMITKCLAFRVLMTTARTPYLSMSMACQNILEKYLDIVMKFQNVLTLSLNTMPMGCARIAIMLKEEPRKQVSAVTMIDLSTLKAYARIAISVSTIRTRGLRNVRLNRRLRLKNSDRRRFLLKRSKQREVGRAVRHLKLPLLQPKPNDFDKI